MTLGHIRVHEQGGHVRVLSDVPTLSSITALVSLFKEKKNKALLGNESISVTIYKKYSISNLLIPVSQLDII